MYLHVHECVPLLKWKDRLLRGQFVSTCDGLLAETYGGKNETITDRRVTVIVPYSDLKPGEEVLWGKTLDGTNAETVKPLGTLLH